MPIVFLTFILGIFIAVTFGQLKYSMSRHFPYALFTPNGSWLILCFFSADNVGAGSIIPGTGRPRRLPEAMCSPSPERPGQWSCHHGQSKGLSAGKAAVFYIPRRKFKFYPIKLVQDERSGSCWRLEEIVFLTLLVYFANKDQESFCFIRMANLGQAFTFPLGPS